MHQKKVLTAYPWIRIIRSATQHTQLKMLYCLARSGSSVG